MTLLGAHKQLDDKYCWKAWITNPKSSLVKVTDQLAAEGKVGGFTGRRFTPTNIRVAAFRWAIELENQAEARKDLEFRVMTKRGKTVSDEEWKQFLYMAVKLVYNGKARTKKLAQYIARNGLQQYVQQ